VALSPDWMGEEPSSVACFPSLMLSTGRRTKRNRTWAEGASCGALRITLFVRGVAYCPRAAAVADAGLDRLLHGPAQLPFSELDI
jgi:hypothetical protein